MNFSFRKFADIGHTVNLQYTKGPFPIAEWADLVTVHAIPGEGILQALEKVSHSIDVCSIVSFLLFFLLQAAQTVNEPRGCLLIAQMSSQGALTDNEDYVQGFSFLHRTNSNSNE